LSISHARLVRGALHCRRGEIELCARLLGIAAAGLNENPGLLGFVVLAKFALLSVMLPLLAFSGLAYTNGDLVPNSELSCFLLAFSPGHACIAIHLLCMMKFLPVCRSLGLQLHTLPCSLHPEAVKSLNLLHLPNEIKVVVISNRLC